MYKIILSTIAVFALMSTHAQTKNKNIIILHPQDLLLNFLKPTYPIYEDNSLYLFSYRRVIAEKNAIRLGLNFNNSQTDGFTKDTLSNAYFLRKFYIGLGYERYAKLTKAWKFLYGADVIYRIQNNNSSNNTASYISSYNTKSKSVAFYPFIGTTVNLNARISIGLETGFVTELKEEKSYSYYKSIPNNTVSENNNLYKSSNTFYITPKVNFRVLL